MRTRSTGSLPSKRTTGVDVNSGGNDNTQNIALEGEGAAANSRNNNNNDSDNEHHGDDAEDNDSSSRQPLRRTSRQTAKRVQSYYSSNDDDDDDDDNDDDDDTSNMSDGAKPKKKGRKKNGEMRSFADTLYNPTDGWVWTFAPRNRIQTPPAMIVKRTELFYQFGMDDPDNYGSVAKWKEFREEAAEKGLFKSTDTYADMKKFYNQSTKVKKGEFPNQPLPHFKSVDELSMARVYLNHSGAELMKKVKYLNEFAKHNGQDVLIIPQHNDSGAVKRLRELAKGGDPTAIEWYDFYLALRSLHVCVTNNPDGSAAHLLDMLKKIGYKDHSSFRDYEQEHLEHCHRLFLCATIGEENIDALTRQTGLNPEELTAQIKQAEESDYFVEALVCDEIKVLTFDFSEKLYDGNEVEVEELYGKHLLSRRGHEGRGWVKVVGKDGIPKCVDCGKASYICITMDHDGPGAVHVKSLRGGKTPFNCTEEELLLQEKLFAIEREKGKKACWSKRCSSCHSWKDCSTIARIIAGEIDRKSDDAGSWKDVGPARVAKMDAIHSSRILSHKDDAWSGEKLEKIKSSCDDAHHVTGSYETALNDLEGGGLWTLDTAKRPDEDSNFISSYSADKLVQRQARRNVVTASTNTNYHKILHTTIHLVELGLLNGGILPWEIRGGYFIVPVSPSVNSSLFKILVDNRSSFDEIDRDKVMSAPRQSFRGGYVLKELETDYSDNDAAQDGDDDRVHDEDGNLEHIGRTNTASGDYTITGTEMAPQVPGFGEFYEYKEPSSGFGIPFSLVPGSGGEDSDDWFEVDADDRIIERGRREKSILEEIEGENYLLNKDKDVDQLTSVIDSDKENIDAKKKREIVDWSITKEDIIDAKKLGEEIAAMKAKRQKCEEYLAATAFVEELS